jgi:diguanylate cyclase (GGDEF)-like protein
MGGDEFYVLIENVVHERDVEEMAQKLLHAASRPLLIGDDAFRLSVSIGIALYPKDGNDGAMLLRNADHAMYRAKDRGKDGYWFYAAGDERHSGEQVSPLSTR